MEKELIKQSNSVTFSKYKMSGFQINALVCVVNQFQKYIDMNIDWGMSEGKDYVQYFKLNKDFCFEIPLSISEVDINYHGKRVISQLNDITNVTVTYTYIDDDNISHKSVLKPFPYVDIDENSNIKLSLPIPSLRWILQWCKNTGLTTFDKKSVLSLKGVYAKRIFQILSSFYKERIFKMKIEKLSDILMTPKYSVRDFERFVLRPAFNEMATNQNSRLFFKYKLVSEGERKTAGRPKRDTVIFKIYDSNISESIEEFKTDNFENE